MKLWEIKAQSLRLMFIDSNLLFNEEEFSDRVVYNNSNTRERLIRMDDSIRRAIDLYYSYVGEYKQVKEFEIHDGQVFLFEEENVGVPSRVDIVYYLETENEKRYVASDYQVTFSYDGLEEIIFFECDLHLERLLDVKAYAKVWYYTKKLNIPFGIDEMTYELNDIYIPEEVQRMIPYFVKSELYEEDEVNIALNAKNEYLRFLSTLRKPFVTKQTKVRTSKIFNRR